jgi:DNA-binding MarR family transcriptional regulator
VGKKSKAREKERERRKGVVPPPDIQLDAPADRQRLAARLNTVAIHLVRRLSREDAALDLTPARLSALHVLEAGGPLTLGSLARTEHVTAPSMTRLVTAMEGDGLVERVPSTQDGRKVFVRVTDAGRSVLGNGQDRRVAALMTWLGPVGADGLRCLDDASVLLETVLRDEHS